MAEEGLSNFEAELKPSLSDYLKLQTKYIEEKEKSLNLEKKNFYLENGLKEKEKQTFQQLIDEKMKEVDEKWKKFLKEKEKNEKEMNEKIQKIKSENEQKDEKVNLLEKEIKMENDLFNKKIADLTNELEQLKNINYIPLNFVKINNKWKEIVYYKCCENECINTSKPIGGCIEGNGFVNLINGENVKYIKYVEGKGVNKDSKVITENLFKKPQNCINYSLFYFEIKSTKIEGVKNQQVLIGLKKCADNKFIRFGAANSAIFIGKDTFNLPLFTWNNNDILGCGLVYPPENVPYIFFTQNGNQIGKAILLNENNDSYQPYLILNCCSVETNFGNNLETKPFIYDFSKHLIPKLENGLKEKEKQTFQQLIDEKMKEFENKFLKEKGKNEKEMNEKFQKIKADNEQKDEKINLLEEQIKKANDLFNKKIADLTNEVGKLKNIKSLNFIKINNKWTEIASNDKCCENECINTSKPIGNCIEGNGFVNLINGENVKYIKCVKGKGVNKDSVIYTENSFKKPQKCINYSLFYFEIKCTTRIEGKLDNNTEMVIGLELEADSNGYIRFGATNALIVNENEKNFKVPHFSWNNNDVFGCGLVYPPENVPYIFFTQNGKQIGKAVLVKDNYDSFKPYVILNCCSIETNFGNNLETKPFIYDFSKHLFDKY